MQTYKVEVKDNGTRFWYFEGELHRQDGPAVEYSDGTKFWYRNGKRHREDGPAIEYSNGTKIWYLEGKLHREDGPAIEYTNGAKYWYLRGVSYSEQEFTQKMKPVKEFWISLNDYQAYESLEDLMENAKNVHIHGYVYAVSEEEPKI